MNMYHQAGALAREKILSQMRKVVHGKDEIIELLLVALISGGHVLLEGSPGLAKTTMARAFAQCIGADFGRIQFTMDLLPSDITGTSIYQRQNQAFEFMKGPIFTNILLADEINRAPAKTQSALLEAMQERQVTVDGNSYRLEAPFLVVATQNPLEEHGVYPLPEGELDRFQFRAILDYPSFEEEIEVLKSDRRDPLVLSPVLTLEELEEISKAAENVEVHSEIYAYIAALSQYSRKMPNIVRGASPRAAIAVLRSSRIKALFEDRSYVLPDDVRWALVHVFNHRLRFEDEYDDYERARSSIKKIIEKVSFS